MRVLLPAILVLSVPAVADDTDAETATRNQVIDALVAGKDLGKLVATPIVTERVWFADPACAKRFTAPKIQRVEAADAPALVRCIAAAKPVRTPDTTWLNALTFEPGYQLSVITVAKADGLPMLQLAGAMRESWPVLSPDQIERARATGTRAIEPDAATKTAVDRDPKAVAFATIRYCVDTKGKVTNAEASVTPKAGHASYVAHALAQVQAWTFKPLTIKGKAVTVCASTNPQYPAGRRIPIDMMTSDEEPTEPAAPATKPKVKDLIKPRP